MGRVRTPEVGFTFRTFEVLRVWIECVRLMKAALATIESGTGWASATRSVTLRLRNQLKWRGKYFYLAIVLILDTLREGRQEQW